MTRSRRGAVAVVVDHVASSGAGRAACRACRRWAGCAPVLAPFACPAEVAAACRAARGKEQDRLLTALLAVSAGDEWAQLTILAGLGGRLGRVVAGWARGRMPSCELADAEAELVAACWAAILRLGEAPPPGRPGLVLVDQAWHQVRVGRRRQRRRDRRLVPVPDPCPAAATSSARPTLEELAMVVSESVAAGRIGLGPARAVYLTRVAGLSTDEAARLLGCGPAVLRVVRARAEHRLAA